MSRNLNVVFISGPRFSGKSTLVRLLADSICDEPPHYIRLVPVNDDSGPRLTLLGDLRAAKLASWRRVNYDAIRIFEFLPECLQHIAEMRQGPTVLIEADADPNLRYAYPYESRIFVMRCPDNVEEVFRSPNEAAGALREVMDDTAAFASEMFGLFEGDPDDDEPIAVQHVRDRTGVTEERMEITAVQMRRFMNTPLGAEIASRIQLQPAYHSLMESEIILVNMAVGGTSSVVDRVINQIQTMISRLGEARMSRPLLFNCDPLDYADPLQYQLIKKIERLVKV